MSMPAVPAEHATPVGATIFCGRCGELQRLAEHGGWEHDLVPGPGHPCAPVPAGADLADECTGRRPVVSTCLHDMRDGIRSSIGDLCPACRRTLNELIDSVLPEVDR